MVRLIMDRYSSVCGDFARGTYRVIEFEAAQDLVDVLEGSLRRQDVDRPKLEVVDQAVTGQVRISDQRESLIARVGPYHGRGDPRKRGVSQRPRLPVRFVLFLGKVPATPGDESTCSSPLLLVHVCWFAHAGRFECTIASTFRLSHT